jgi:hypothetical protein
MHEAPVPLCNASTTDPKKLSLGVHINTPHCNRGCRVEWIQDILDPEDVIQSVRYRGAQSINRELHVQ